MAFSLQEALEQIRSDKIKDRQQGLEALEHIFSDQNNVNNLDPKQDGKAWLKTFQALFACVLAEKAACIRKGSFLDAQPIALARLQRAAQMLRSLVEKAASLLTRKVVKAILTHILQMLNHRGALLRPVAPAYISALCAILKHQHHVDHLDPEDWRAAATLCFDILLGRHLDGSAAAQDPAEWLALLHGSAAPAPQQRGLSLEDAVTAECLRSLMACTVAPLLGEDGHGLSLLSDYTRFLLTFPSESSAHLPAMTGLVALLEHLELNHTREVLFASLALRSTVLSLWKTKNHLLKVQLLLFFRIVVPIHASHANGQSEIIPFGDPATLLSTRTDAVSFLEQIHETLLRDPDTRWALDPIKMDALVFHWPPQQRHSLASSSSPLSNIAFHIGPYSTEQDSLAWCRLCLQVDIIGALAAHDSQQEGNGAQAATLNRQAEHSQLPPSSATSQRSALHPRPSNGKRAADSVPLSPQKRRRTNFDDAAASRTKFQGIPQLIEMVSGMNSTPNVGASARFCALQLLTFLLLHRPDLVDSAALVDTRKALLSLAADTDHVLVCWSFVGLAAVMLASAATKWRNSDFGSQSGHPNVHAWGIAVRKLQFPETCRASAFLLSTMLAKSVLPDATLQPEISRLVAEIDLQGPPILCDSVCHLMTLLLHQTNSNRIYQHLDARRKIGAWFANTYSPADTLQSSTQLAASRASSVFVPYQDLSRMVSCIIADREADQVNSSTTYTRSDDVAELLRRRAQLQPLRDLVLQSQVTQMSATQGNDGPSVEQIEPPLLSMEAFNRVSVILEKKIEACLAVIDALTSEVGAILVLPFQAATALMHAATIAAVRASTKFRTFAALASESRSDGLAAEASSTSSSTDAAPTDAPGKISPPTKRELYSEDEDDEADGNEWFDTEDGNAAPASSEAKANKQEGLGGKLESTLQNLHLSNK